MSDLLLWMKEDVEQTGCSLSEERARQWSVLTWLGITKTSFQKGGGASTIHRIAKSVPNRLVKYQTWVLRFLQLLI
jgi:hypothetical protein